MCGNHQQSSGRWNTMERKPWNNGNEEAGDTRLEQRILVFKIMQPFHQGAETVGSVLPGKARKCWMMGTSSRCSSEQQAIWEDMMGTVKLTEKNSAARENEKYFSNTQAWASLYFVVGPSRSHRHASFPPALKWEAPDPRYVSRITCHALRNLLWLEPLTDTPKNT